jgi:hypothetical protein
MPTDDEDVRDLFAHANPDTGPQLGISAADVAARGRRVHRRRRQLAAAGSTVAVIALAAVLTTTLARPQVTPAGPSTPTQVPITHTGAKPRPLPTADGTPPNATPPPTTTAVTTTVTPTSQGVPTP